VGLSAGAGCGKTHVLTQRFLRECEELAQAAQGIESGGEEQWAESDAEEVLRQLVAITFTERAARQMRDRIRRECRAKAYGGPRKEQPFWRGLLRELDQARIGTIHSFCAGLLRAYPVEAGVAPRFTVLAEGSAALLLYQSTQEVLTRKLEQPDPAIIELVVTLGVERLFENIAEILNQRPNVDWSNWLNWTPEKLAAHWQRLLSGECIPQKVQSLLASPHFTELLGLACRLPVEDSLMRQRCQGLQHLAAVLRDRQGDLKSVLQEILEHARVQGVRKNAAWWDGNYERFKDCAHAVREEVKRLLPLVEVNISTWQDVARLSLALLHLAHEVLEHYEGQKTALPALDFHDLVLRAVKLLEGAEGSEYLSRWTRSIRLLMVDEFQDTDLQQTALIRRICGEKLCAGKLFFVGDYKQSIYRFRGANPEVFHQLRGELPAEGQLALTQNFRSQPGILHFVNALFCDVFGESYEPLRAHRPQVNSEPIVEFLWAAVDPPEEAEGIGEGWVGQAALRQAEAEWIARRLRQMFDRRERLVAVPPDSQHPQWRLRPVRPGDVAILLRALSDVELYEEALQRYQIEYYLVRGQAFYAQQEVFDLMHLLRAICDPCDALSLAGMLRSPFFSLDDETIFWLAQQPGGLAAGFFAPRLPAELSDRRQKAVLRAREILARLRAVKDRLSVAELIEAALEWTGYDAAVLAEFLGTRKLANLRKLLEQARSFDAEASFTLTDFVWQLSEFVARQPPEALAPMYPEASDVVRLMTIHQAKGLEFPVVVVADVDRSMRGPVASLIFSMQAGPMLRSEVADDSLKAFVSEFENQEKLPELMRLFYVATTRAADYLIVSAGLRSSQEPQGPWTMLLESRFDLLTGELTGELPAGYEVPRVKVTYEKPSAEVVRGKTQPRVKPQEVLSLLRRAESAADERQWRFLAKILPDTQRRREYSYTAIRTEWKASELVEWAAEEPSIVDEDRWEGAALSGDEAAVWLAGGKADRWKLGEVTAESDDGIEAGLLAHEVLRQADFATPESVLPTFERLAVRFRVREETRGALRAAIRGFVASGRGRKIAEARQIFREVEFLLGWPPGSDKPGRPFFRGFIDCLYEDAEGRWRVLDYKTAYAGPGKLEAEAERYRLQLFLYGLAAEEVCRQPPAELVLCFLLSGDEYAMGWDSSVRREAIDRIEARLNEIRQMGR